MAIKRFNVGLTNRGKTLTLEHRVHLSASLRSSELVHKRSTAKITQKQGRTCIKLAEIQQRSTAQIYTLELVERERLDLITVLRIFNRLYQGDGPKRMQRLCSRLEAVEKPVDAVEKRG